MTDAEQKDRDKRKRLNEIQSEIFTMIYEANEFERKFIKKMADLKEEAANMWIENDNILNGEIERAET